SAHQGPVRKCNQCKKGILGKSELIPCEEIRSLLSTYFIQSFGKCSYPYSISFIDQERFDRGMDRIHGILAPKIGTAQKFRTFIQFEKSPVCPHINIPITIHLDSLYYQRIGRIKFVHPYSFHFKTL